MTLRVRPPGWAFSLTLGTNPRRFAWGFRPEARLRGYGVAGSCAFGFGVVTYLRRGTERR
jgi:hypothetical protein